MSDYWIGFIHAWLILSSIYGACTIFIVVKDYLKEGEIKNEKSLA